MRRQPKDIFLILAITNITLIFVLLRDQIQSNMKHIIAFVAIISFLNSCVSVNYLPIDVRQPALVSFPPNVTKVLLVDNSYAPDETPANDEAEAEGILSTDSSRTVLLTSLKQFMDEEKYFNTVDLYPYKTYSGTGDDEHPLSARKIQTLCVEKSADAVVTLDWFVMSAQLETENTGYFNTYNILGAKLGAIARAYDKDGSEYIHQPIVLVDSLFREEAIDWSRLKNNVDEINSIISEMATVGADKLTGSLIPSWKSQMRWYYSDNSSDMKQAGKLASSGKWKDAAAIWGGLFDKETKAIKKIRLASNIALANESLDDVENAKVWINIAYELLPEISNAELTKMVTLYRNELTLRGNNLPKLYEQLGIEKDNID